MERCGSGEWNERRERANERSGLPSGPFKTRLYVTRHRPLVQTFFCQRSQKEQKVTRLQANCSTWLLNLAARCKTLFLQSKVCYTLSVTCTDPIIRFVCRSFCLSVSLSVGFIALCCLGFGERFFCVEKQLYKRLCPSVRPFVRGSVTHKLKIIGEC